MLEYIITTCNGAIPHIVDDSNFNKPILVYFDDLYYKDSFYYTKKEELKKFLNTNKKIYLLFKNKKKLETKKGMLDITEEKYNEMVNAMQPDYYEVYGERNNGKRRNKKVKSIDENTNVINDIKLQNINNENYSSEQNLDTEEKNIVQNTNVTKYKSEQNINTKNYSGEQKLKVTKYKSEQNINNEEYYSEKGINFIKYNSNISTNFDEGLITQTLQAHVVQSFDKSHVDFVYTPKTVNEFVLALRNNKKIIATDFINNVTENKKMIYFDNNVINVTTNYNCNCCNLHNGYLQHLWNQNEISALTLTNIHNYKQLDKIYEAINKDNKIKI